MIKLGFKLYTVWLMFYLKVVVGVGEALVWVVEPGDEGEVGVWAPSIEMWGHQAGSQQGVLEEKEKKTLSILTKETVFMIRDRFQKDRECPVQVVREKCYVWVILFWSNKLSKTLNSLIHHTVPGLSLLSDDGLKSAFMHFKQNKMTKFIFQQANKSNLNKTVSIIDDPIPLVFSIYPVMVGRAARDLACWGPKVLRGWGRGRDCRVERGEVSFRGQSLHRAASAGGGSPLSRRPRHLTRKKKTSIHKLAFTSSPFSRVKIARCS